MKKITLRNGELFNYDIKGSVTTITSTVEIEIPFLGNQVLTIIHTDEKDLELQVSQFIIGLSGRIQNDLIELDRKQELEEIEKRKKEIKDSFKAIINITTEDGEPHYVLHVNGKDSERDSVEYSPDRGDMGFNDLELAEAQFKSMQPVIVEEEKKD